MHDIFVDNITFTDAATGKNTTMLHCNSANDPTGDVNCTATEITVVGDGEPWPAQAQVSEPQYRIVLMFLHCFSDAFSCFRVFAKRPSSTTRDHEFERVEVVAFACGWICTQESDVNVVSMCSSSCLEHIDRCSPGKPTKRRLTQRASHQQQHTKPGWLMWPQSSRGNTDKHNPIQSSRVRWFTSCALE